MQLIIYVIVKNENFLINKLIHLKCTEIYNYYKMGNIITTKLIKLKY